MVKSGQYIVHNIFTQYMKGTSYATVFSLSIHVSRVIFLFTSLFPNDNPLTRPLPLKADWLGFLFCRVPISVHVYKSILYFQIQKKEKENT